MTRAGYYAFLNRKKSKTQIENEAPESFIARIFEEHSGRYGANRIVRELAKMDIHTSKKRVSRIMTKLGIKAKGSPRPYRYPKASSYEERANIVDRVFTAPERNRVWVGDITYVPTKQGFLYLAVMIDIYSKKIVGWSMSSRINENLTISALDQAIGREEPSRGLVVHTDRGSQYTSKAFQKRLDQEGFVQSMSRKGNPYDSNNVKSGCVLSGVTRPTTGRDLYRRVCTAPSLRCNLAVVVSRPA